MLTDDTKKFLLVLLLFTSIVLPLIPIQNYTFTHGTSIEFLLCLYVLGIGVGMLFITACRLVDMKYNSHPKNEKKTKSEKTSEPIYKIISMIILLATVLVPVFLWYYVLTASLKIGFSGLVYYFSVFFGVAVLWAIVYLRSRTNLMNF